MLQPTADVCTWTCRRLQLLRGLLMSSCSSCVESSRRVWWCAPSPCRLTRPAACAAQVFPRPKLDAALEARRLEREEATRQAKANLSKRQKTGFAQRTPSSTQLAASGGGLVVEGQIRDAVHGLLHACTSAHKLSKLATNTAARFHVWMAAGGRSRTAAGGSGGTAAAAAGGAPAAPDRPGIMVMLHPLKVPPLSSGSGSSSRAQQRLQELAALPKPYITVPAACRLPVLKTYVVDRLAGKKGEASRMPPLHLECAGQVLGDDWSVQEVFDKVWQLHQQGKQHKDEVMVVYYAATRD